MNALQALMDVLDVINNDPDIQEVGGKPLRTVVRQACVALAIPVPAWITGNVQPVAGDCDCGAQDGPEHRPHKDTCSVRPGIGLDLPELPGMAPNRT